MTQTAQAERAVERWLDLYDVRLDSPHADEARQALVDLIAGCAPAGVDLVERINRQAGL